MDIDAQRALITTADVPFNDSTDSVDLVIRTADNVDFFVLSALLSLRSPSSFFRQALQGNKHTEERDGFPILKVTDDSDTFRTILLLCYPYIAPEIESVQRFLAVGLALDKYCMDHAMERFVAAVLASSVISEQPLRVFALAVANGWKEIGEAAARNTLATPLNQAISDVEELNEISARHLYCLQDYHARCGKAVQLQGLRASIGFMAYDEECRPLYSRTWLTDTYFRLVNAKLLLEPWPQVALDDHIISQIVSANTKQCRGQWNEIAGSQIRRLGKIAAEEIDRRISEVPLGIEWRSEHQNEKDGAWNAIWKVFGMSG
ncbi:uncharacterized protein EV420DRAFT_806145 [Desarmillaria tabescens]|uniref:BTB domain-containing protein n=1 Tax=Armillaria tabescens TaxID=1929756 RepID=A0AA39NI16_ARMTA|nr:uncharacterized protein EV420DRAFT_806145 [Desarmillaria tabescens]KAK0466010.1 hypothetical protein EV420DRAFT_806145 [Desarmillaria tabescens]